MEAPGSLPIGSQRGTRPLINLGQGRILIVPKPCVVRTVLGSCVAVILHVPRLRISALCHAQLPEKPNGEECIECRSSARSDSPETSEHRFVTCCIRSMLNGLARHGAERWEVVAKIYGGAHVVSAIHESRSVAGDNLRIAQSLLDGERIRLLYSDIGGSQGRTIEHETDTNVTRVRLHGMIPTVKG